ncbi:hypothetical protein D5R40_08505 [Okeania hirsuta]|uniref:Uncharacterized protein n=2 Tax=Microcoleaceae TaxID=1892252 RepID=A0A3N6RL55_9CYAN|nr:hypothetical protein D4Z78_20225 [Okeania hirsuta]RQH47531.1 hypothetical protein D5R40_08505 [Okeania hirsuta]
MQRPYRVIIFHGDNIIMLEQVFNLAKQLPVSEQIILIEKMIVELRKNKSSQYSLMPLERLQSEFAKDLAEAGYKSREDIVNLVREVRKEISQ